MTRSGADPYGVTSALRCSAMSRPTVDVRPEPTVASVQSAWTRTVWGPRALAVAALCGPIWPTQLGVAQLMVGRVLIVVIAAGIVIDLAPVRGRVPRPLWAAGTLMAALVALAVWTWVSAATAGCFCSGTAQGFGELVVLLGLAVIVALYAPGRWLVTILGLSVVGVALGGLLAVVGLRNLHAGVYSPSASTARLEGVYGNPNFLGYALALALPFALALSLSVRGARRYGAIIVTLALGAMLVATYSRGSLLAAAAGAAVVIAVRVSPRLPRRIKLALVAIVPVAIAGIIISPFYKAQRISADFGTRTAAPSGYDESGWDTGIEGPIRVAGAVLANRRQGTVLLVATRLPGQGVGYDLGGVRAGGATGGLQFSVRAAAPTRSLRLRWAVATLSGRTVAGGRVRAVDGRFTPVVSRFPRQLGQRYLTYVWAPSATGTFALAHVAAEESRPGVGTAERPIPTQLLGSGATALARAESQYNASRWAALRLALDAFAAHPILGIGLDRFVFYSDIHAQYGLFPTHDAYTQVLAELGLLGACLLLAAVACILVALIRTAIVPLVLRTAVGATIVAGAVNLVFINGLAAPGTAMPLVIAVAIAVAGVGAAPNWWPRGGRRSAVLRPGG
jgi:O-antigen ligase